MYSPIGLIDTEIHFDYIHQEGPNVNITLDNIYKQWNLLPNKLDIQNNMLCTNSFFSKYTEYDISMKFVLAKSSEHRCMIYFSIIDCEGSMIAKSYRSLKLPYRSKIINNLDLLFKWPLYMTQVMYETETINVNLMEGFQDLVQENGRSGFAHSFSV
jgi:hypothetical protein